MPLASANEFSSRRHIASHLEVSQIHASCPSSAHRARAMRTSEESAFFPEGAPFKVRRFAGVSEAVACSRNPGRSEESAKLTCIRDVVGVPSTPDVGRDGVEQRGTSARVSHVSPLLRDVGCGFRPGFQGEALPKFRGRTPGAGSRNYVEGEGHAFSRVDRNA
jgi:hypothetical protein